MSNYETELRQAFLADVGDVIEEAERILIDLERDSSQTSLIKDLFRIMHNFKGSAAGVGFTSLAKIMHEAESLLSKIKQGQMAVNSDVIGVFLKTNDYLRGCVEKLKSDLNATLDNPALLDELKSISQGGAASSAEMAMAANAVAVAPVKPIPTAHMSPAEPTPLQTQALSPAPIPGSAQTPSTVTPASAAVAAAVAVSAPAAGVKPGTQSSTPPGDGVKAASQVQESIRVQLGKIELLLNEIGELVILQTLMSQNRSQLPTPMLRNTVLSMEKIIRTVQLNSMSLRMVSLRPLIQKLERIVRDTSKALGKEVEFIIEGVDTEIDKIMMDQISDPLVHIVRNSVDHGLESPEERKAKGKPTTGRIRINAFQRGDQLVIQVDDDGKGLDPKIIRESAVRKGLISADANLSDQECRRLIFQPGFSTKAQITDISGRGVGMDVVLGNVQAMQGRIDLDSETGQGTSIKIFLPSTLAIIEGVVVQIGEQRFVIPLSQILEYQKLSLQTINTISRRGEVLLIRGEDIPLVRMAEAMKTAASAQGPNQGTLVIVQSDTHGKAGLVVDRVLRQQQIVIKKLSPNLKTLPGFLGAAVMGDGRVAMILDIQYWINKTIHRQNAEAKPKQRDVGAWK